MDVEKGVFMDLTKSQICKAAKGLFNEKGYQAVSMRQIAAAAGISLGTLTYHYAHKQDLMGAIMDSTIKTFPATAPQDIGGLCLLLKQLLESIADSPFYFNDPSIYRSVPQLQTQNYANVGHLFELFETALKDMAMNGLFVPELTDMRIHQLTMVLMLSHTGWSQYNSSRSHQQAISLEEMLAAQWAVLYPYLTPKGKKEYEKGLSH